MDNPNDPQFAGAIGSDTDPDGAGVPVNFDNQIDVFGHQSNQFVVNFDISIRLTTEFESYCCWRFDKQVIYSLLSKLVLNE